MLDKLWTYRDRECVVVKNYANENDSWRCGYILLKKGDPGFRHKRDLNALKAHKGITFTSETIYIYQAPWYTRLRWWFLSKIGFTYWIGFDCDHEEDHNDEKSLDFCVDQCQAMVDDIHLIRKQKFS